MRPKINRLRDADIHAISIVSKGANGKRICLFKTDDDDVGEEFDLHPQTKIAKAADWSAFYVVVAEPGWLEKPGMYGDQNSLDVWESEEEIRKAAHRFMKNGGLVNKMHQDMEPFGELVESAIALDDIRLVGETIKKGSWYVAIEPTDEGKSKIDAGEFTGVSIQGTGQRISKESFSKPGTADVTPSDRKKIEPLARHYLSKPHPFTACVRDQVKHGLSEEHANRRCAVLLDTFDPTRARHSVQKSEVDAAREAFDALPEDIGYTPIPDTLDPVDDQEKVGFLQKAAEFFGLSLSEDAISKADGATLGSETEEEQGMDQETKDRFEALEGNIAKIGDAIGKLTPSKEEETSDSETELAKQVKELLAKVEAKEAEDEAPKVEDVQKSVDELIEKVGEVVQAVDSLSEGGSTQEDVERVEKKDASPLAGLLD